MENELHDSLFQLYKDSRQHVNNVQRLISESHGNPVPPETLEPLPDDMTLEAELDGMTFDSICLAYAMGRLDEALGNESRSIDQPAMSIEALAEASDKNAKRATEF